MIDKEEMFHYLSALFKQHYHEKSVLIQDLNDAKDIITQTSLNNNANEINDMTIDANIDEIYAKVEEKEAIIRQLQEDLDYKSEKCKQLEVRMQN